MWILFSSMSYSCPGQTHSSGKSKGFLKLLPVLCVSFVLSPPIPFITYSPLNQAWVFNLPTLSMQKSHDQTNQAENIPKQHTTCSIQLVSQLGSCNWSMYEGQILVVLMWSTAPQWGDNNSLAWHKAVDIDYGEGIVRHSASMHYSSTCISMEAKLGHFGITSCTIHLKWSKGHLGVPGIRAFGGLRALGVSLLEREVEYPIIIEQLTCLTCSMKMFHWKFVTPLLRRWPVHLPKPTSRTFGAKITLEMTL